MKRILSIVLLFAIFLCMTACGNENQQGQTDADSSAKENGGRYCEKG